MIEVSRHRARQTGLEVAILDNREAAAEIEGEPTWYTMCVPHGQLVGHYSRYQAEAWAPRPMTWCEVCNGSDTAAIAMLEREAQEREALA